MPVLQGMSNFVRGAILLPVFFLSVAAHADGDAERGAVLADTCLGCHGIPGYRNAYPSYRVPKLGGQHEEYLYIALQGYRNKMRPHPTMQAQSATLSEQDMRDLAAFFAAQGEPEKGGGGGSAGGREKAAICTACHGATGLSPSGNWPNLAGQHEDYMVRALRQYRSGERKDPVMAGQAVNLSDEDIADLAAYYAAQSGLFTASYGD